MKQVLSEPIIADQFSEIAVGRRDQADIDLGGIIRADAADFPLLDHSQELHLEGERRLRDFIQKCRASGGAFQKPFAGCGCAGKGSALVAKELAFQQCFRHCTAVDHDERRCPARAVRVKRSRDQFLARPAFPNHEHRSFDTRDFGDLLIDVDHLRRGTDNLGVRKALDGLGSSSRILNQSEFFFDAADDGQHFINDEGFADVIECSVVDGTDGGLHGAVSCHNDDLGIRIHRLHALQQLQSRVVAQIDIADEDIETFFLHRPPCLYASHGHSERIRFHLENRAHQLTYRSVIVDHEDSRFSALHTSSVFFLTELLRANYANGPHTLSTFPTTITKAAHSRNSRNSRLKTMFSSVSTT